MAAPSLEPARPATLRLSFAPDLAAAREVSVAIRNFLAEQGVAEKELFSYELCIAEASNNAVEYAEGPCRNLRPIAEALFTPSQIELRVTDHSAGFDLPERIPPPPPMTDRGRGLFLIQSVMDEVRYLRGTNENILVMRKKRKAVPQTVTPVDDGSVNPLSYEKCKRDLAAHFRSLHSSRSFHRSAQGGLGIGLTLVRTLVKLHGGTVTASNRDPARAVSSW